MFHVFLKFHIKCVIISSVKPAQGPVPCLSNFIVNYLSFFHMSLPFKSLKVFKVLSKGRQENAELAELEVVVAMLSSVLGAYYHQRIKGFFPLKNLVSWPPWKGPCTSEKPLSARACSRNHPDP